MFDDCFLVNLINLIIFFSSCSPCKHADSLLLTFLFNQQISSSHSVSIQRDSHSNSHIGASKRLLELYDLFKRRFSSLITQIHLSPPNYLNPLSLIPSYPFSTSSRCNSRAFSKSVSALLCCTAIRTSTLNLSVLLAHGGRNLPLQVVITQGGHTASLQSLFGCWLQYKCTSNSVSARPHCTVHLQSVFKALECPVTMKTMRLSISVTMKWHQSSPWNLDSWFGRRP